MASLITTEFKCSRSPNSLLAREAALFGPVIKNNLISLTLVFKDQS